MMWMKAKVKVGVKLAQLHRGLGSRRPFKKGVCFLSPKGITEELVKELDRLFDGSLTRDNWLLTERLMDSRGNVLTVERGQYVGRKHGDPLRHRPRQKACNKFLSCRYNPTAAI